MSVSIDRESPLRARMTSWRSSSSRSARWAGVIRVAGLAAMAALETGPGAHPDQSHPQLDREGSKINQVLQGSCSGPFEPGPLRRSLLDRTPAHFFQACTCLFVKPIGNPAGLVFAVLNRGQGGGELGGADLGDLLAGRPTNGCIRRNETDALTAPMLGGEALEKRVGVRRETDLERPVLLVDPDAVEDNDPTCTLQGYEARKQVDELSPILVPGRVEDVVAVEEVQGRVRHRAASWPRRGAAPPRRSRSGTQSAR